MTRATLTVLSPGLCTLVVDSGRPRWRSLGVPVGGPADAFSFALGNLLVGNAEDAPALEIALAGPALVADAPLACAFVGAPFGLATDRRGLAANSSFTLEAGEALRIGGTPTGARAYLCVAGGIDAPLVMGSRSGLERLKAGDALAVREGRIGGRRIDPTPQVCRRVGMRLLPAAQAASFPDRALERRSFRVSPACDRMGLRLLGDPLPVPAEMVSEPVCPGTVQVARDGQCIVLGVDGQTIGGYPKIAQVIRADLPALGQLRPGDEVLFRHVSLDEAEEAWHALLAALARWRAAL
ncbi:MAG: biotin-dependent carboxyltransferase family protein [Gemmataceae bacterium]|nr:biotin-dependent carboxyltransferase family protein [Gemmataceae bacterium]